MTACSIETCANRACSRGLCDTHRKRQLRGAPLDAPVAPYGKPFEAYVHKSQECWLWTGGLMANGYGRYRIPGAPQGRTPILAHRYAYKLAFGAIPVGLQIDHLCRVRSCVNPEHLEPVTPAENLRRARVAKREGAIA